MRLMPFCKETLTLAKNFTCKAFTPNALFYFTALGNHLTRLFYHSFFFLVYNYRDFKQSLKSYRKAKFVKK